MLAQWPARMIDIKGTALRTNIVQWIHYTTSRIIVQSCTVLVMYSRVLHSAVTYSNAVLFSVVIFSEWAVRCNVQYILHCGLYKVD